MKIIKLEKREREPDMISCEVCGPVQKMCAVIHKDATNPDGSKWKVYAQLCEDHYPNGDFKGEPDEKAKAVIKQIDILSMLLTYSVETIKLFNVWLNRKAK